MPTYTCSHLEGLSVSPAPKMSLHIQKEPSFLKMTIQLHHFELEGQIKFQHLLHFLLTPPAVVMTNWTVDIDESVIHPSDELHAPRVWLSLGMQRMRKGPACWSSRCANVGIAIVVRIYSPIFSHHFLITGHFLCLQDLPWGLNQMVLPLFREINMAGLLWILFLQMIDLACD